jgi:hypothetical protein
MKPAVQVGSFVGLILFTKRVFATSAFFPDFGCEFSPLIMLLSIWGSCGASWVLASASKLEVCWRRYRIERDSSWKRLTSPDTPVELHAMGIKHRGRVWRKKENAKSSPAPVAPVPIAPASVYWTREFPRSPFSPPQHNPHKYRHRQTRQRWSNEITRDVLRCSPTG